jgi:hypothetical protein
MTYFANNMILKDLETYQDFLNNINWTFIRISGPYGQVITLSYTLVISAILTTFMYLKTEKKVYFYNLLFIFLVSVMSLTRSAVGGVFIMLLFLASKERVHFMLLITIGIIYIIFLSNFDLTELNNYSRVVSTDDSSAQGKVYLWITGIIALILHPFGITEHSYMEVKEWVYSIYHNLDILRYPSHNGIINVGFEYTLLGIFVLIYFIVRLFKISRTLEKRERKFWLFAFFSYIFQQSFHNNGIFYVEFNVLMIIALYLVEINKNTIIKKEVIL